MASLAVLTKPAVKGQCSDEGRPKLLLLWIFRSKMIAKAKAKTITRAITKTITQAKTMTKTKIITKIKTKTMTKTQLRPHLGSIMTSVDIPVTRCQQFLVF